MAVIRLPAVVFGFHLQLNFAQNFQSVLCRCGRTGRWFSDVNIRVLGVLFTVGPVFTVGQVSGTRLSVLVCTVWFSAILIGPGRCVGGPPPRGLGVRGGHMNFWWYACLRWIEAWLWRFSEAPQQRSRRGSGSTSVSHASPSFAYRLATCISSSRVCPMFGTWYVMVGTISATVGDWCSSMACTSASIIDSTSVS